MTFQSVNELRKYNLPSVSMGINARSLFLDLLSTSPKDKSLAKPLRDLRLNLLHLEKHNLNNLHKLAASCLHFY